MFDAGTGPLIVTLAGAADVGDAEGIASGVGVVAGDGMTLGVGCSVPGAWLGVGVEVLTENCVLSGCDPLSHADNTAATARHSRPIELSLWTFSQELIGPEEMRNNADTLATLSSWKPR